MEETTPKPTPKGKPNSKKQFGAQHHLQDLIRLADPNRWSLKGRFLYLTGALLILGNLILIGYLHAILDGNIDRSAQGRLALVTKVVTGEVERMQDTLHAQAMAVAEVPSVQEALDKADSIALGTIMVPYINKVRHGLRVSSLDFHFAPRGAEGEGLDPVALRVNNDLGMVTELRTERQEPQVLAAVPLSRGGAHVGSVVVLVSLRDVLARVALPPEYGLAILRPGGGVLSITGNIDENLVLEAASQGTSVVRRDDQHYTFVPLLDMGGTPVANVALSFNAALLGESKWNKINLFSWFFLGGALVLWFVLYANVARIERFFRRLKKIIISSHSNYFGERFESDHVHCLDVLHCHNEECPVYQNPTLVCYLETGSEAISPRWRDTCIFLNKYDSCKCCPVYIMRRGDELTEMRNVVNTMMRLWSDFLSRVGHLLAYVLRSQEQSGQMPSLDEISDRLEEMARLSFFSHDLQGVLSKDEVYAQLGHVFSEKFGLHRLLLYEVHTDGSRVDVVLDRVPDEPLCRQPIIMNSEACRACRTAEDVSSFYNPVLCPHFNCDLEKDVRCCMPVVMGGKVGAVISFVAPKHKREELRKQLPVLRKYLDETAPVISSLRLLRLSKEQALRDPLTRCHNRRFLDEFITKFEPLAERENRITGLLMCDIDYFKQVNDEYGHEAGDAVLKQVVDVIQESIRKTDLLIRYGGEEFLALLQNVEPGTAELVAEKIRDGVEQAKLNLPGGNSIKKTISVGVAEFPKDGQGMYKAIKFADVALYEAKNTGRNKVIRFAPAMWTEQEY